ncbi:MAG: Asp-tRNA(Asn)/Glu-tRNA(Gln) amidotransferase subunit GatA [Planctomycetota bacterium]
MRLDSIDAIASAVRRGETTATAVTEAALDRARAGDGDLLAFRELGAEDALAAAARVDATIADGRDPGPLAGVPIAVKDNLVTAFGTTCAGSRMLDGFRSPYTATAVERLIEAGAIPLGKTNCDEFAMGSSTEHCAYGATRNPWATDRVPGGSSGGSAAAVAAGFCPASLGTDTGGSIRQPAALCGIVGLKPTYGRVSRHGLIAFGSSLDQIGPLTRSVGDAARVLSVIAGRDPHDSTSVDVHLPDLEDGRLEEPVDQLRVGVPRQYRDERNHPAVNAAVEAAIDVYRSLGATIVDVDLPLTDHGIATYYVIAPAEASSNLARYDGIRYGHRAEPRPGEELFDLYARSRAEGFGPEVRRRIMLGTYVLSAGYYDAYYKRALQVRRLIGREFEAAFSRCHVILGPTSPFPAFRAGEKTDPLAMYLCDVFTANANIAGIPGISIPGGFAEDGGVDLPVGLHLQARAFDEGTLLRAARMFERATTHHLRSAPGVPDVSGVPGASEPAAGRG